MHDALRKAWTEDKYEGMGRSEQVLNYRGRYPTSFEALGFQQPLNVALWMGMVRHCRCENVAI